MEAKRNSFLEIFRFVFSLFILFYHNLFFVQTNVFGTANFVLDFFFMLSGLFMIQSLKKYDNMKLFEGLKHLLVDRLKNIWIPLIISLCFVILSWFLSPEFLFKPRLLWFVFFLLIIYVVYYFIRRLVKSDKKFMIFVAILGIIALLVRFSAIVVTKYKTVNELLTSLHEIDELRGVCCVPIGMLIGFLPDMKFSDQKSKNEWQFIMFAVSITLVGFGVYTTSLGLQADIISEIVLDFVAFPIILYSSRYYKFNSTTINILGCLSPYIYIYQQIPYTMGYFIPEKQFLRFLMVLVPVLIHLGLLIREEKLRQKRLKYSKI